MKTHGNPSFGWRNLIRLVSAMSIGAASILGSTAAYAQGASESVGSKNESKRPAVSGSTESQLAGGHHQKRAYSAAELKPNSPSEISARMKYGGQEAEIKTLIQRPSSLAANRSDAQLQAQAQTQGQAVNGAAAALAGCDLQLFATSSGASLVNAVKASSTDCVGQLFSLTGSAAGQTLSEAKMVTIADAFRTVASSYGGNNASSAMQLILFLRAGYYVNWYYSADTGPYGAALKTAMRAALDAFVNNGNFTLVNNTHGEILAEFVTLLDSSSENARYLSSVVKRLLDNYNSSFNNHFWMQSAVNNTFTILFRGHDNAAFATLVQADTSITDTLYNFINNNFNALGGSADYLVTNAGRELSRFLKYTEGSALKNAARPKVKLILDRSNVTGSTAALWVAVGGNVDYYDKANCSYYNLCDFVARIDSNVLPIKHSCSGSLRLKAQSLTPAQLSEACAIVGAEEGYFHTQVASGKVPVANDNNTHLEMVIFSSSKDYKAYAGALFGIDTNNGGMYLEGSPDITGNQARFIAYQAEWLLPKFEIWNLTHEYIHYLDGRFNMYGDFGTAIGVNSVWWLEGFAEYMSYSYRKLDYVDARNQATAKTYALSTIFKNDYNSGTTRVYSWGYLAVRYMFEKQRSQVSNILGYFRPGNYAGYTSYMNSAAMSASMDAGFKNWLTCAADAALPNCADTTPPANVLPMASFNNAIANLQVNFTDTSTDGDGSIASRLWNFGDGSSSTAATVSHSYAAAGSYTVSLTVTDNSGGKATVSRVLTVQASSGNALPVAKFSSSVNGLTVNFADQSTDSDGSISSRAWTFGDGTSSNLAAPVKTYAAAGSYSVMLTVTDNKGGSASSTATVVVQAGTLPECTGAAEALGKNCVKSNLSGGSGSLKYMYVYIPAGTTAITISSAGGSGNADLYVNTSTWATSTAYNYRSIGASNAETITITNPPGNSYIYLSLYGKTAYSGVQVKTQY